MIKDPPLLTLKRNFRRPDPVELASFAEVQTSYVVDAMNGRGALDHRIKPLAAADSVLIGTAVTCHCGPADNLALFAALAIARPGDILLAATDGFTGTSVAGDLLMGMAFNRGLLGLVTDGLARDLVGILGVGLPVYCAGLSPNSPARNGPGTAGLPIMMGGMAISSGDIVIADNDGVVIVPLQEARNVIGRLSYVRAAKSALEGQVRAGLEVPDFIKSVLASDRIVEID